MGKRNPSPTARPFGALARRDELDSVRFTGAASGLAQLPG